MTKPIWQPAPLEQPIKSLENVWCGYDPIGKSVVLFVREADGLTAAAPLPEHIRLCVLVETSDAAT